MFRCPGCGHSHEVAVGTPFRNGARWTYNGNPESPTFQPSLHVKSGHYVTGESVEDCWLCKKGSKACGVCHSFVTDGQIQFLADCTHELAGQTVPIPPWDREEEA
ncbi:MAG: DUF6527 family protein [Sphingobium sp.]|nr:DUF6527 family protein [Sphingobium sp.]